MPLIELKLKNHSYPITIGRNASTKLVKQLKRYVKKNKLFVFYDANFYALHGVKLSKLLKKNFDYYEIILPAGEKTKSEKELSNIHSYLLSAEISRSDFLLAVGGGVTSDIVGYAAASVLRGVKWGVVSTTLLGMVDAAIGGKTGINHKTGKNLIGAFWQPSFVHCDVGYLHTLPGREMNTGFGEIVKYGGLIGTDMLNLIERYLNQDDIYNESLLIRLIAKSVEYKSKIVKADERESGQRMYLNFGHTIGHAIENSLNYGKLKHGEAVLLGLYAAMEIHRIREKKLSKTLAHYRELIAWSIGMIPYIPLNKGKILTAIKYDKKRIDSKQKFILLERVSKPAIIDDISKQEIEQAIENLMYFYKHGEHHG